MMVRPRLLGALALASAVAVGCGAQTADTADRTTDGFGGSGGAPGSAGAGGVASSLGGSAAAGASQAGAAGSDTNSGSAGAHGLAGGPQAEPTLVVQRPGLPRALVIDGAELRWVLAATATEFEGPVESIALTGGEVTTTVPATPATATFSSLPGEPFVYTAARFPIGGLRRVPKTGGAIEILFEDPEPSFDLAVLGQVAFRVRGGEHAETWVERIDLPSNQRTRISTAEALDAYIGDFATDGSALFYTMQAFGKESGLYRAPLEGGSQQLLAPGSDDVIGLAGDEIIRIRRGFQVGGASFVVDAVPKTGGEPRPLFESDLGGLGRPTRLGDYVYFVGLGTINEPHKLVRAPLAGGPASLVVETLCPPDSFTPSLVASDTALYVACTTEGTIRAIVPPS